MYCLFEEEDRTLIRAAGSTSAGLAAGTLSCLRLRSTTLVAGFQSRHQRSKTSAAVEGSNNCPWKRMHFSQSILGGGLRIRNGAPKANLVNFQSMQLYRTSQFRRKGAGTYQQKRFLSNWRANRHTMEGRYRLFDLMDQDPLAVRHIQRIPYQCAAGKGAAGRTNLQRMGAVPRIDLPEFMRTVVASESREVLFSPEVAAGVVRHCRDQSMLDALAVYLDAMPVEYKLNRETLHELHATMADMDLPVTGVQKILRLSLRNDVVCKTNGTLDMNRLISHKLNRGDFESAIRIAAGMLGEGLVPEPRVVQAILDHSLNNSFMKVVAAASNLEAGKQVMSPERLQEMTSLLMRTVVSMAEEKPELLLSWRPEHMTSCFADILTVAAANNDQHLLRLLSRALPRLSHNQGTLMRLSSPIFAALCEVTGAGSPAKFLRRLGTSHVPLESRDLIDMISVMEDRYHVDAMSLAFIRGAMETMVRQWPNAINPYITERIEAMSKAAEDVQYQQYRSTLSEHASVTTLLEALNFKEMTPHSFEHLHKSTARDPDTVLKFLDTNFPALSVGDIHHEWHGGSAGGLVQVYQGLRESVTSSNGPVAINYVYSTALSLYVQTGIEETLNFLDVVQADSLQTYDQVSQRIIREIMTEGSARDLYYASKHLGQRILARGPETWDATATMITSEDVYSMIQRLNEARLHSQAINTAKGWLRMPGMDFNTDFVSYLLKHIGWRDAKFADFLWYEIIKGNPMWTSSASIGIQMMATAMQARGRKDTDSLKQVLQDVVLFCDFKGGDLEDDALDSFLKLCKNEHEVRASVAWLQLQRHTHSHEQFLVGKDLRALFYCASNRPRVMGGYAMELISNYIDREDNIDYETFRLGIRSVRDILSIRHLAKQFMSRVHSSDEFARKSLYPESADVLIRRLVMGDTLLTPNVTLALEIWDTMLHWGIKPHKRTAVKLEKACRLLSLQQQAYFANLLEGNRFAAWTLDEERNDIKTVLPHDAGEQTKEDIRSDVHYVHNVDDQDDDALWEAHVPPESISHKDLGGGGTIGPRAPWGDITQQEPAHRLAYVGRIHHSHMRI